MNTVLSVAGQEDRGNSEVGMQQGTPREEGGNAEAKGRREEDERGPVACGGMGILPMTFHGRPARRTSCRRTSGTSAGGPVLRQAGTPVPRGNLGRFRPAEDAFPPIGDGLQRHFLSG